MENKRKSEFIRFLKENGAYIQFVNNLMHHEYSYEFKSFGLNELYDRIKNMSKESRASGSFILWAFHWEETDEGHNFWSKLQNKLCIFEHERNYHDF